MKMKKYILIMWVNLLAACEFSDAQIEMAIGSAFSHAAVSSNVADIQTEFAKIVRQILSQIDSKSRKKSVAFANRKLFFGEQNVFMWLSWDTRFRFMVALNKKSDHEHYAAVKAGSRECTIKRHNGEQMPEEDFNFFASAQHVRRLYSVLEHGVPDSAAQLEAVVTSLRELPSLDMQHRYKQYFFHCSGTKDPADIFAENYYVKHGVNNK